MQALLMWVEERPSDVSLNLPPDEMYDKIELAITCNEQINDSELNKKIIAT